MASLFKRREKRVAKTVASKTAASNTAASNTAASNPAASNTAASNPAASNTATSNTAAENNSSRSIDTIEDLNNAVLFFRGNSSNLIPTERFIKECKLQNIYSLGERVKFPNNAVNEQFIGFYNDWIQLCKGKSSKDIKIRITIKDALSFIYTLQNPGTLYLDLNCVSGLRGYPPVLRRIKYLHHLKEKINKVKQKGFGGVFFPYLQSRNKFTPDFFSIYNYNYELQEGYLEELIKICSQRNKFSSVFNNKYIFNRGGEYIKLICEELEKSHQLEYPENELNEVLFIWIGNSANLNKQKSNLIEWCNIFERVTLLISKEFIPQDEKYKIVMGTGKVCEIKYIEDLFTDTAKGKAKEPAPAPAPAPSPASAPSPSPAPAPAPAPATIASLTEEYIFNCKDGEITTYSPNKLFNCEVISKKKSLCLGIENTRYPPINNGIYCSDIESCTEKRETTKPKFNHSYAGKGTLKGPPEKHKGRERTILIGEDLIETTDIKDGITGLFPFIKYSSKSYTDNPVTIRGKRSLKKKRKYKKKKNKSKKKKPKKK